MIASNPLIAIILAISMLLSSAGMGGEAELPKVTVTLTNAAGETISFGSVNTDQGLPALFFDILGSGMTFTGDAAYLMDGKAAYAFNTAEVFRAAAAMVQALSAPLSDEDMAALSKLGQGILQGISSEACKIALALDGLNVDIDVDKLAHELHMAVPVALLQYGTYVDPILERYTAPLLGQKITCMNLAEIWLRLGLDTLETGIKVHLQVKWSGENVVISGSACDIRFQATANAERLYFSVITPDNVAYQFDTDDLGYLLSIFASVPAAITEEAFLFNQETVWLESADSYDADALNNLNVMKPYEYEAVVTTIALDTGALSRDLNNGLVEALTQNKAVLDMLINKYRSWFALMDEDVAAALNADALIEIAQMGVIALPETKGQLVVEAPVNGGTVAINGYFGNYNLIGAIEGGRSLKGEFVLYDWSGDQPVETKLEFQAMDDNYQQYTSLRLSSDAEILGLFRSLNFAMTNEGYMTSWNLTTDTDVLHAAYSDKEMYLDIKAGVFNFLLEMDENEAWHYGFTLPEFFVDVHAADGNFSLDSSVLGLDYSEAYDGFVLNGYICEYADSEDRLCFGISSGNYGQNAYIKDNWNKDIAFSVNDNAISFRNGYDVYTLMADYMNPDDQLILIHNGEVVLTMKVVIEERETNIFFYEGIDTTVAPVMTLTFDFDPDPITLPDAIPVDMDQFVMLVNQYMQ